MKPLHLVVVTLLTVALVVVIVLAASSTPTNISGSYVIFANGKESGSTLTVKKAGSSFIFEIRGENGLQMTRKVDRNRQDSYRFDAKAGRDLLAQYEIFVDDKADALVGTAWILPVGRIELAFERSENIVINESAFAARHIGE